MKKHILITAVLLACLTACVKDDSLMVYPGENPNFSSIDISSPLDSLSVDFGTEFIFTPEIKQKVDKKLSYEWKSWPLINGTKQEPAVVGSEETLSYVFPKSGAYALRLEVKNEDYSAFKEWYLQVRVWDEGYFVVGEDEAGNSNIAFARKLSPTDIAEGKELTFETDLINRINPELAIKNVVRIGKSTLQYGSSMAYLFIFTKNKIFVADAITFEVFNVINFSGQFGGNTIKKVSIDDSYSSNIIIFSDQGNTFVMNKFEQAVYEAANYSGNYEGFYGNMITTAYSNQSVSTEWVDYSTSKIWEYIFYHGAGGPINQTTGSVSPYEDGVEPNLLEDYYIQTISRMNGDITMPQSRNYFAVAVHRENPLNVRVWEYSTNYSQGFVGVDTYDYTATSTITLPQKQALVPNARFGRAFYYYNGSGIYKWNPYNLAPNNQLPSSPVITLDAGKVVTCMTLSYDMRQLYVGFYDAASSNELKGGMYIYNCEDIGLDPNIRPVKKFENVTYKPKQILYKSFEQGNYNSTS